MKQPTLNIPHADKIIGGDDVFVIAEVGKNFIQTAEDRPVEEYLKNAKDLVDAAMTSGADAVKFQTHELEDEFINVDVTSPHFKGSDRYSWIKRNMDATPLSFWRELKQHCDNRGIIFFSTPMSRKAAMKLEEVGVPLWKIGSGDVHDHVTLDFIAGTGKPLIISSGMVSLLELDDVIARIRGIGIPLAVLYCVSQYPCPPELFNLATIAHLREKYPDMVIGFSDHSVGGHEVDLAAVKLGARIIEKHFSFSRDLWGADHKASITPDEMRLMVEDIRNGKAEEVDVTPYFGDRLKELEGANSMFRPYFNKALVAGADMPAGTLLTKELVFAMRPKMYIEGASADMFDSVVGKKLRTPLRKYEPITEFIFE